MKILKKFGCCATVFLYWYLTFPLYLMYCSYQNPFYHPFELLGPDHTWDWAVGLFFTILGLLTLEYGEALPAIREARINKGSKESLTGMVVWSKIFIIIGLAMLFLFHIVFIGNVNYMLMPIVEPFMYISM